MKGLVLTSRLPLSRAHGEGAGGEGSSFILSSRPADPVALALCRLRRSIAGRNRFEATTGHAQTSRAEVAARPGIGRGRRLYALADPERPPDLRGRVAV